MKIATIQRNRKSAALNRKNQEEHPKINLSRDIIFLLVKEEDDVTQLSEEVERRVDRNLSKDLGTPWSLTRDDLSELAEFLQKSQIWVQSTTPQGLSWKFDKENKEVNGDSSQKDLLPPVAFSVNQYPQPENSDAVTVLHNSCGFVSFCSHFSLGFKINATMI